VLGYVGLDDDGLGGVEREFQSKLTGKPGKMLITMDNKRRWLGRVEKQPDPGENVVLTIDEKIQYIVERSLRVPSTIRMRKRARSSWKTRILEKLLALANWPTFNPNVFNKVNPQALRTVP